MGIELCALSTPPPGAFTDYAIDADKGTGCVFDVHQISAKRSLRDVLTNDSCDVIKETEHKQNPNKTQPNKQNARRKGMKTHSLARHFVFDLFVIIFDKTIHNVELSERNDAFLLLHQVYDIQFGKTNGFR